MRKFVEPMTSFFLTTAEQGWPIMSQKDRFPAIWEKVEKLLCRNMRLKFEVERL